MIDDPTIVQFILLNSGTDTHAVLVCNANTLRHSADNALVYVGALKVDDGIAEQHYRTQFPIATSGARFYRLTISPAPR